MTGFSLQIRAKATLLIVALFASFALAVLIFAHVWIGAEVEAEMKASARAAVRVLALTFSEAHKNIRVDMDKDAVARVAMEAMPAVADHGIVDRTGQMIDGVATIFATRGRDQVRISTTVKTENGARAVGTTLAADHPARASLDRGQPYYGPAVLFGRSYVTGYQPILGKGRHHHRGAVRRPAHGARRRHGGAAHRHVGDGHGRRAGGAHDPGHRAGGTLRAPARRLDGRHERTGGRPIRRRPARPRPRRRDRRHGAGRRDLQGQVRREGACRGRGAANGTSPRGRSSSSHRRARTGTAERGVGARGRRPQDGDVRARRRVPARHRHNHRHRFVDLAPSRSRRRRPEPHGQHDADIVGRGGRRVPAGVRQRAVGRQGGRTSHGVRARDRPPGPGVEPHRPRTPSSRRARPMPVSPRSRRQPRASATSSS